MTLNLPPPKGFASTEGFKSGFAGAYAQVIPQKGLISVIWSDEQLPEKQVIDEIFPEEEFIHTLSITRNPQLTYHALKEYWRWHDILRDLGATEVPEQIPCQYHVVKAWRPFYEALTRVYSKLVDQNAKLKDLAYLAQISRHQLRKQRSSEKKQDAPADTDDGQSLLSSYINVEQLIGNQIQSQLESLITDIINEYVIQGLLDADLEAWNAEPWFKIERHGEEIDAKRLKAYQLIERFVPYALYSENLYPLEQDPADYWIEIKTVLTDWCTQIAQGESPFPVEDRSLGSTFLTEWIRSVCGTVRMLDLAIRQNPGQVATSLPPIFSLLHPFLIDHSILSTPTQHASVLYPCVLIPTTHSNRYYFLWLTRHKESIAPFFFKDCYLYNDLDQWRYGDTIQDDTAGPATFITHVGLRLQEFLLQLEDLWLYQQAEATCPHCQYLLNEISKDTVLPQLLERRVFTSWKKTRRIADLVAVYPRWVAQEVTATHHKSPIFEA